MIKTVITPRVSETDGVGHINNTTIPIWFEAGRNEIFRMFMPDLSFRNWRCIIIHMSVDYIKEVFYGEDVHIHTHVEKIGNTSFVLHEELFQKGKLCAQGKAVYVNVNQETGKKEPIPDYIRQQLEKHLL